MADFQVPSAFDASGQSRISAPSEIDVSSVDRTLRSINSIERSWRLPALPEEVKLDLATLPGVQSQSISDLLLGLDDDMHDEEPAPEDPAAGLIIDWDDERSQMDRFRVLVNQWRGELPPSEVTIDAVRRFKLDAIRRGYIDRPVDGRIDSTWSPELNRVRRDMLYDDIDSMYAGNRAGAVPTNKVIETLGKWTSPSGLLSAATQLDLFWDFGAIGREFSSWGDKWRKVGDSSGPLDFAKNLVDAVTGPIDDIVIPAANLLLLGSGVGAMANIGRVGITAERLSASRRLMGAITGAARLAPTRLGVEGGMATASLTSNIFSKSRTLAPLGGAMQAWRELPVVQRIKQGVQLGMRTGFISQAEDLLPGYQGGADLTSIDRVEEARQRLSEFGLRSPLATLPELMFAPQNIFNPGSFRSIGRAGAGFLAAGGTLPGRAVVGAVAGTATDALVGDDDSVLDGLAYGALGTAVLPLAARGAQRLSAAVRVGPGGPHGVAAVLDDVDPITTGVLDAATGISTIPAKSSWARLPNPGKYIGWVTDGLAHLDFKPLAEDQRISNAFHKGIRRWLETDPDSLSRWDDLFTKHNSFKRTLQEFYGLDERAADASMAFVAVSAALDHTAALQAGRKGDAFMRLRTKLVSQLDVFDLDDPALVEKVARAMAIDSVGTPGHVKRYKQILGSLTPEAARREAEAHNRLAQATLQQLVSLDNVEDILDATADPFAAGATMARQGLDDTIPGWRQAGADERVSALEAYVSNVAGTFGRWDQFSKHTLTIDGWMNAGWLDDAEFLPVFNPTTGAYRRPRAEVYKIDRKTIEASEAIVDERLASPAVAAKTRKAIAPLAASQPSGRFTIARSTFVPKQAWEEAQTRLTDTVRAMERLQQLRATGSLRRLMGQLDTAGLRFDEIDVKELDTFLKADPDGALGLARGDRKRILGLRKFMESYGFSANDLDVAIDRRIEELAASPFVGMGDDFTESLVGKAAWTDHGFDAHVLDENRQALFGLDALKERAKQVAEKARQTAAEIDVDKLSASIAARHGDEAAADFRAQVNALRDEGYKLVHGVEFLMPTELVQSPLFRDHGIREMNAATFGNFFSRRQPAVARMIQERRERTVLADVLGLSVDDQRIGEAQRHLRQILEEIQQPVIDELEVRDKLTAAQKVASSIRSSFTPVMLTDLTWQRKIVVPRLRDLGWSETEAQQIFSGLRRFRNTEFRDVGLYAIEAKLRSKNLNVSALKWLSGEGRLRPSRLGAIGGAVVGADVAADDDDSLTRRLAGAAIGGVVGAGVGTALSRGASAAITSESLLAAEQRAGFQIGDHLARWRDTLRFTLSPMFEISRFTEGVMLGKTGMPLRDAAGNRLVLPARLDPTAVKRRIGEGAWKQARAEFSTLLRSGGHGDIDVADDMVQRFSQVGIFGFNPQHWQVAAYAEMRRAGVEAGTAFEHAIETYTYGIRGRSPAELSVNAVFFPFSFQKKALGHIAEWVADDLSRSILIHDGLKAYEALSEEYDLDVWFEDHIPALDYISRLNVLAYGVSPGRFGGINAQAIETLGKSALLFMPMAFEFKADDDPAEFERMFRSLIPAWNDINWMIEETKNTKSLVTDGALPRAQVRDGYNEWNQFRNEVSTQLSEQGLTWYDLHNRAWMADQKRAYETKLAEIQRRYPAWVEARRRASFNAQALEMEKQDRLRQATTNPEGAAELDLMLAAMETRIDEVKDYLSLLGVSVDGTDGWLDAPPEAAEAVREEGIRLYEANPMFIKIWRKFYEPEVGPIEERI